MSWILAVVGALFGAILAEASRAVFGLVAGALMGALLGQAMRLRSRLAQMESRLAFLESPAMRHAAEAPRPMAPAAAPDPAAPPAATARPAPEQPATPAHPAQQPVAPARPVPGPPPVPARPMAEAARPASMAGSPAPGAPAPIAANGQRSEAQAPTAPTRPWTPPPRDTGPDAVERAVAVVKGWLFEGNVPVKLGLLVLMFGLAAAMKYAADAGLLRVPIEVRLSLIAAGAIAGLVWGLRSAAARPAFGLSLQGGAIGILLLTVFAAFRLYQLLDPMPAFVMVVVLVAGASVLAVRQNAPALAVLGFIGGYLAPVLISTGSGNHVALFSYYAVLNAAVFGIAWHRPWRALNLVGFAFTFIIGGVWGAQYYRPELFASVEPFLVLFFAFYVAIPVLYALAGREKNGKVDGTLLFGTPLLAFPMQAGLLEGDRMLLAVSAVVVAAIYAGLALWSLRNPRLRVLAQSSAAMGVVFATLAVPLALSARWTSAAWALQGVGMVWLGLRQSRRITRWSGLALLLLAGIAWLVSLFDHNLGMDDRFLLNGHVMNLSLLALATLLASWLYEKAGRSIAIVIVLFLTGLGWWALLGMREIEVNLDPVSDPTAYGVFAAITAALAALLRGPVAWPRLGWPVALASGLAVLLAITALQDPTFTWFAAPLLPWWGITLVLLLSTRGLVEPDSRGLPVTHLAAWSLFSIGLGLSLQRYLDLQAGLGDGWQLPAALLPVAALFFLAWRRPAVAGWPVATDFPSWRQLWLALSGVALALGWLFGQLMPGSSAPLAWLPVLNPLELSLLAGLALGAWALREHEDRGGGKSGWSLWAGAALLTLTTSVLRACHHLAALPWSSELLTSRLAQSSLTVAWCVAGVAAWVAGSRRRNWSLWMFGAGIQLVVLAKLLVVDRQFLGNITGIVSFIAVGLLLTVVGYLAPNPPRKEST